MFRITTRVRDTEVSHYTKVRGRVIWGREVHRERGHNHPKLPSNHTEGLSGASAPFPYQHLGQFHQPPHDPHCYQPGPATPCATYLHNLLLSSGLSLLLLQPHGPWIHSSNQTSSSPISGHFWFHSLEVLSQVQHHLPRDRCPKFVVQMISPYNATSKRLTPFLQSTDLWL